MPDLEIWHVQKRTLDILSEKLVSVFWESHHYLLLWETSLTPSLPLPCSPVPASPPAGCMYEGFLSFSSAASSYISSHLHSCSLFTGFPHSHSFRSSPFYTAKGSFTNDNYIMFLLGLRLLASLCFL